MSPPPILANRSAGRLRWSFAKPVTRALTLTYQVRPEVLGTLAFTGGYAVITDTLRRTRGAPIPSAALTVTDRCEAPTATPTDTPVPTGTPTHTATPPPTPTPTATPTATDAPTAAPTPTVTPRPRPLYLPLVLGERCVPEKRRVDVALVVDASTSMTEPTAGGRTKLDMARTAAGVFLDQLHFDRGDQVALVAFNRDATLLQGLTGDRAALDAALGAIQVAPQTCLACGVAAGADELAGARKGSGHQPVLVLMTDGRSNPRPVEEAVARAGEAKAGGVVVFTIGLGDDLDEAALVKMASTPAHYHHAPEAAALADIYRRIAVDLPCPAEQFWGGW